MTKRVLSGIGCSLAALACCIGLYNGGSLDTTEVASATLAPLADLEEEGSFSTSFTNTDGSVQFFVNIPQSEPDSQMPKVYVRPHYLTGEDARRVAEALFPEAEFFEAVRELAVDSGAPIYSKAEIQAKLDRWAPYATQEALDELLGETGRERVDVVQSFLVKYTEMYDHAPVDNPHKVCTWELRKESEKLDANDVVFARFFVDGIPYRFTASVRNKADFKVSNLSCYIYDGRSPLTLDDKIFRARLCRTAAPTDEQVAAVRERAQELLDSFGLGQWQIARCEAKSSQCGIHTEHTIWLEAVPVLGGVPALLQPQRLALRNLQGEFMGHYLTSAEFVFAPNGELLSFNLYTPLDVQRVERVEDSGMTMQQIMSMAQEQLVTTGPGRYGWYFHENVKCNVFLEDIHYGLTRMDLPGEDAYVYVPAASLWGVSEYMWDFDGEPFYQNERDSNFLTIPFSNQT